ncbi:dihydrofolate reductase-like domain-containing protein, partial [Amylocystis lapponica]
MVMTHWMRTMHDAILVGIGTAINDDPQLNVRHLPPLPGDCPYSYHLPRPVILDTNLRLPSGCKLLKNYSKGGGRRPWIVCSYPNQASEDSVVETAAWLERKKALEHAGAYIVEVPKSERNLVAIPALLRTLHDLGIRSLMVEGGARVIRAFLATAGSASEETLDESSDGSPPNLVDMVIVTVAPMLVGANGVGYGSDLLAEKVRICLVRVHVRWM